MFIFFIHTFLAYLRTIALIWEKQKWLLFTVGLTYVVGFTVSLLFFYHYEVSITNYIIDWMNFFLKVNLKTEISFDASLSFFIGVFSYRTCLLLIFGLLFHVLLLLLFLPLYYAVNLHLINQEFDVDTHIGYSWERLGEMYLFLFSVLFYRLTWTLFYLVLAFLLSFLPYVGVVFVFIALLVISYFLGHLFYGLGKLTGRFYAMRMDVSDTRKIHFVLGGCSLLFFLIPLVGWIYVPLAHIPCSLMVAQRFPQLKR